MNSTPPAGANLFVWILAESQRIRQSAADREADSIRRIEAKQHGNAQERRPHAGTPSR